MDGISDLIIRIKNASDARKESVTIPHSNLKEAVLELLKKEGYILNVAKKGKKVQKSLEVELAYDEFGPRVKGVLRVSKLSKRIYSGAKDLKRVMQGHGMQILTTPSGIMTDAMARKQKVGGEVLFKIW